MSVWHILRKDWKYKQTTGTSEKEPKRNEARMPHRDIKIRKIWKMLKDMDEWLRKYNISLVRVL